MTDTKVKEDGNGIKQLIDNIDETLLLLGSTLKASSDAEIRLSRFGIRVHSPTSSYAVLISSKCTIAHVIKYSRLFQDD